MCLLPALAAAVLLCYNSGEYDLADWTPDGRKGL